MKVKVILQFLGAQVVQGKRDTTKFYNTVSFLDGTQSVNIMVNDVQVFNVLQGLPQLTEVDCILDVSMGKYTSVRLLDAVPVKSAGTK